MLLSRRDQAENWINMIVGIGAITIRLHGCSNLIAKRKILKSLIGRIRSHFNPSIAEINFNDYYQKAEVGFAAIGNDTRLVNAIIDKVFNFADQTGLAEILDTHMEIIHITDLSKP